MQAAPAAPASDPQAGIFAKDNLVAWCIVPFDSKKRGPEERAAMLEGLGIKKLAYDWRDEHIPTFDEEVAALKRHGVEMTAWWFPGGLNDQARNILDVIKRNDIHPQLWVCMEGGAHLRPADFFDKTPEEQQAHVERVAAGVKPIAEEADKLGLKVALYNHGGWFGVPENQIAIIELLKQDGINNVGMVYTQHHGHGDIERFPEVMEKIKPYLLAISLNGMIKDGDLQGHDTGTTPIGQGDQDLRLLKIIKDSGWTGPVGIIGETVCDMNDRLQDNIEGLEWVNAQLEGKPVGPRPKPRTWTNPNPEPSYVDSVNPSFGKALSGSILLPGKDEYRLRPLTVDLWAKLDSAKGFNILVASDPKGSAEHWELYTYADTGEFSVFQPGRGGDFHSNANICDGKWHHLTAILGATKVTLYVDGKKVHEAPASQVTGTPTPGGLAIGRLVEGGYPCDGLIDDVRIAQGEHPPSSAQKPLEKDAQTVGLWNFDQAK